jgi:hypothetical protein
MGLMHSKNNVTSFDKLARMSNKITRDFHVGLVEKIMRDGGDYVIIFGNNVWKACKHWFPKEKVLNHQSILHGSVISNNFHNKQL